MVFTCTLTLEHTTWKQQDGSMLGWHHELIADWASVALYLLCETALYLLPHLLMTGSRLCRALANLRLQL